MNQKLDIDNPFFNFMGGLADVAIVNLLFFLFSLPVFTIGASTAAMYQAVKGIRAGQAAPARCFAYAFKESFKTSFAAWMFQLFAGGILVFDLMYVTRAQNIPLWHMVGMAVGCMLLLWVMVSCYLLPAGVYKGRRIKAAVLESFLLAVRNFPYTLVMSALNVVPAACFLLGSGAMLAAAPIYLIAGFGITAYINTMLLEKCKGLNICHL